MKNRMNSSLSSNHPGAKYVASAARNCFNSVPQTAETTFDFSSVFILLQYWCIYWVSSEKVGRVLLINLLIGLTPGQCEGGGWGVRVESNIF